MVRGSPDSPLGKVSTVEGGALRIQPMPIIQETDLVGHYVNEKHEVLSWKMRL